MLFLMHNDKKVGFSPRTLPPPLKHPQQITPQGARGRRGNCDVLSSLYIIVLLQYITENNFYFYFFILTNRLLFIEKYDMSS